MVMENLITVQMTVSKFGFAFFVQLYKRIIVKQILNRFEVVPNIDLIVGFENFFVIKQNTPRF